MNKIYAIIVSLFLGCGLMAQGPEIPQKRMEIPDWQLGIVITDFAVPAFTLDANIRIQNKHHIGLRLSAPSYQSYDTEDLYQSTVWALKTGVYHKIYMPLNRDDMLTFRHGFRFGVADLQFNADLWQPFERNGNTFLEYQDVTFTDRALSLGYEIMVGWQSHYKFLFYEIYFGATFETIINEEQLTVLDYKSPAAGTNFNGPGYEYQGSFRPVLGMVIGLGDSY
jgi:hypothetical protein